MIIYPDTCFYGRPFDNQSRPDIKAEANAIKTIIRKCKTGGHRIIGSATVIAELEEIKDDVKRNCIEDFYYMTITDDVETTEKCYNRADGFVATGVGIMDSQHLAIAEAIGADFLLTVDKAFIIKSNNLKLNYTKVMNPIDVLKKGLI
jgi:hypothetical protein